MTKHIICRDCGFVGRGTVVKKGSKAVEWMLWVILLVPGPFYSLWRHLSKRVVCTKCGEAHILGIDTDEGKILLDKQLRKFN